MATVNKKITTKPPVKPKAICQNPDCMKMGRHLTVNQFYPSRNISIGHHPWCKECVEKSIDLGNMQTVYDVLKILDVGFMKDAWDDAIKNVEENYIDAYLKAIKNKFQKKYSTARWSDSVFHKILPDEFLPEEIVEEQLPDEDSEVKKWSEEWQGSYTKKELRYLDDYYRDLQNDFKIVTRNHRDYARKIAQASLAMNIAFNRMREFPEDKDLVSNYKFASANFDVLSKSAQFAESQRGANDVSLGCFGKVFDAVEKHNWVPTHIPEDKDMFDKIIEQFSNIKKSL